MGSESEIDMKTLVAKYALLFAKYGIGKLWMKSMERPWGSRSCLDNGDLKSIVRIRRPCRLSATVQRYLGHGRPYTRHDQPWRVDGGGEKSWGSLEVVEFQVISEARAGTRLL